MGEIHIHNEQQPNVITATERENEAAKLAQTTKTGGVKSGVVSSVAEKSLSVLSDGEGKDAASQLTKNTALNSFISAKNIKKNNQTLRLAQNDARKDFVNKSIENNTRQASGGGSKVVVNKNGGGGSVGNVVPSQRVSKNVKNLKATENKKIAEKKQVLEDYKNKKSVLLKNNKVANVKTVGAAAGGFISSALGESDEMREVDSLYSKGRGAKSVISKTRAFRARRARKSAAAAKKTAEATAKTARAARAAKAGAAAKGGATAGGVAAGGPVLIVLLIIVAIVFLCAIINGILAAVLGSQHGNLEGDEAIIAQTLSDCGYNNAQIAAIMSNMYEESKYNPRIFQDSGEYDYLSAQQIAMAGGYGLCQWDDRKVGLCNYCDSKHTAHCDIVSQCEWTNIEARGGVWGGNSGGYYSGYFYWDFNTWISQESKSENVDNLSKTWTWQFERCANWAFDRRVNSQLTEAHRIFDALESGMLDVVGRARAEIGKPYVWGAVGPEGYDCSGFVSYCLTGQHIRIGNTNTFMGWPRTDNPVPGDVCTSSEHCGIYIGNGQMIHAPQPGESVKIGPVQAGMIYVKYPG